MVAVWARNVPLLVGHLRATLKIKTGVGLVRHVLCTVHHAVSVTILIFPVDGPLMMMAVINWHLVVAWVRIEIAMPWHRMPHRLLSWDIDGAYRPFCLFLFFLVILFAALQRQRVFDCLFSQPSKIRNFGSLLFNWARGTLGKIKVPLATFFFDFTHLPL